MKITLSNRIKINITLDIEQQIIDEFTFANPKYQDAISFGRSTYNIDRRICLIDTTEESLMAPMGILDYLLKNFNSEVEDNRTTVEANIPFTGLLRPYQEKFIGNAKGRTIGMLIAATRSGKILKEVAKKRQTARQTWKAKNNK